MGFVKWRLDERRRHRVDADPVACKLDGHGLGKAFDGVFRHAVHRAIR